LLYQIIQGCSGHILTAKLLVNGMKKKRSQNFCQKVNL